MASCSLPRASSPCRPGKGNIKFYYHGPQDNRERYYRVSFREIPTRNRIGRTAAGGSVGIDPVVVMETILVVRPRQV